MSVIQPIETSLTYCLLGQSQWKFHRVSWALNTLTWHCIDEERDDESFIGVERISWGWNSSALFSKYGCVRNWVMKPPLRPAKIHSLKGKVFNSLRTTWNKFYLFSNMPWQINGCVVLILLHIKMWWCRGKIYHYWIQVLCRVPEALGKGQIALGKAFAECNTRQWTHGKKLIGKTLFAECL